MLGPPVTPVFLDLRVTRGEEDILRFRAQPGRPLAWVAVPSHEIIIGERERMFALEVKSYTETFGPFRLRGGPCVEHACGECGEALR